MNADSHRAGNYDLFPPAAAPAAPPPPPPATARDTVIANAEAAAAFCAGEEAKLGAVVDDRRSALAAWASKTETVARIGAQAHRAQAQFHDLCCRVWRARTTSAHAMGAILRALDARSKLDARAKIATAAWTTWSERADAVRRRVVSHAAASRTRVKDAAVMRDLVAAMDAVSVAEADRLAAAIQVKRDNARLTKSLRARDAATAAAASAAAAVDDIHAQEAEAEAVVAESERTTLAAINRQIATVEKDIADVRVLNAELEAEFTHSV